MFLGVPFQVWLFRGSALTVLPRCRFVPHLQCYRAGQTRSLFPLCSSALQVRPSLAMFQSGADTLLFPLRPFALQVRPSLAMLQNGSDSIVPPSLSSTLQVRPSLAKCYRTVRSAAFHPRFLPRCRFVPRLQCYRTASDSLAPLLSLTQRNACQPCCRDTCPRHGAVRQSGIPTAYPTTALRSAVG